MSLKKPKCCEIVNHLYISVLIRCVFFSRFYKNNGEKIKNK